MTQREKIARLVDSTRFQNAILAVILVNAATLGLETSATMTDSYGTLIKLVDRTCLAIFVAELLLKFYARRMAFFTNGWSMFDLVIVAASLIPGASNVSVLRAARVLRVLRVVSAAPRMRRVVEGLVLALPGIGSVFLLMGIVFYIGSVMATNLFGDAFPDWFGTLGRSGYSLFQIMTLESWSMGIVRPVMEVYPFAWLFFVPFILVTTFAVVNLLVGLMVNSMQDAHESDVDEQTGDYRKEVMARLDQIQAQLDGMKKQG
ncbi:ion transporter [Cognatishimia activa]|uniref:Ion transporter n=1 Tax=Cognatishimia activa TaxID=1715691 RepID=A0A975ES94_9RHOB|nr:ion transporter [Cognatishimia activa]QTN36892.1 ion transporter [Cognatishimia activa]